MAGMYVGRRDPELEDLFTRFAAVRERLGEASSGEQANRLRIRRDNIQRQILV